MKQVAGKNKGSYGLEVATMKDGSQWVSVKSFCGFLEQTADGLLSGLASPEDIASNLKMSAARLYRDAGLPEPK